MPMLNLEKLTDGLTGVWSGYVRDWDRTLRVATHPETTRYNYLLAAAQLGRYLAEYSPDPEAVAAAEDPTEVRKAHVESFLAWMSETRTPSTALNKYKGLPTLVRCSAHCRRRCGASMWRVKSDSSSTVSNGRSLVRRVNLLSYSISSLI